MVDFTGGTWRSLIDGSEVGAIPDELDNQYRGFDSGVNPGETVDPWPDQVGNDDLNALDNANNTLNEEGVNGVDSITIESDDDGWQYTGSSINAPCSLIFTLSADKDANNNIRQLVATDEEENLILYREDDNEYRLDIDGNSSQAGPVIDGDQIITLTAGDGSAELRVNGDELISISIPSEVEILSNNNPTFWNRVDNLRPLKGDACGVDIYRDAKLSGDDLTDAEKRAENDYNMDVLN